MINELAQKLNDELVQVNPVAFEVLSDLGKRIYFPSKGILSQSAEAKKLAKDFNATIGTAMEKGQAMHLPAIMDALPELSPNVLLYAPSSGLPALRQAWKAKILHDNPSLDGVPFSLPVVTNGLTQAIALAGDLFVNPGDTVLVPDLNWDNYLLNFIDRLQAKVQFWPFFANGGVNLPAFRAALDAAPVGAKIFTILNFPNNPTGYTPSDAEGQALAEALLAAAERGVRLVVLVDDAYYGLFYAPDCMRESLFCRIAGKSPNLIAMKADAATKECYVWGLRCGFLSFAAGGAEEGSPLFHALEQKTAGLVRSTISNCPALSQHLVAKALANPDFYAQRAAKAAVMEKRCRRVAETLAAHPEYAEHFVAYPFNSGYFMCVKILRHPAEAVRRQLLDHYATGGIAIGECNFRIAFSSLEEEQIPQLFDNLHRACKDLG